MSSSAPTASQPEAAVTDGPLLLAIFTEAPLHAGTGQSTGIIDLPVQRERHTQFPIIPATSMKGSLRERAERRWGGESPEVSLLFGPQVQQAELHAGALAFSDARIAAFPVRSLAGVFQWVTCPLVLGRLSRDLSMAGMTGTDLKHTSPPRDGAFTTAFSGTMVLEDLTFDASFLAGWDTTARRLTAFLPAGSAHEAYREKFASDLVLVSDDDFRYLVQHATQVTARIALNDKKTTTGDGGNLWYEETVPADTLLYALVRPERPRTASGTSTIRSAEDVRHALLDLLAGDPPFLQLGGNETIGHGWCALKPVVAWEDNQHA